jgi:predicted Zn finger-like uncharacterized protein
MSGLPVTCPGCASVYLLPESLMGEGGARVSCPSCGHPFAVTRDGTTLQALEGGGARPTPRPATPAPTAVQGADARDVAREVLDELAARLGSGVEAAAREQRLFSAHGPELFAAYDEFRRRVGGDAGSAVFREELKVRWGVDLFPTGETRR